MEKYQKLSKILVEHSLQIQKNEKVLIMAHSQEFQSFLKVLIMEIVNHEGIPFVKYIDDDMEALLKSVSNDVRIEELKCINEYEVEHYDAFISIHYHVNDYSEKIVPTVIRRKIGRALEASHSKRINDKKWVIFNYPSANDAYRAWMTNEEFYDYAFDVMTIDYQELCKRVQPLQKLMEKTDMVRIVGPGTDLTFSIKGIPAIACCGEYNIPDGEVYTAPILDSVNGVITYNTPSPYQGQIFQNVSFTFEQGKIVKCSCVGNEEKLKEILDTDDGARYIGEFAIGVNPCVMEPIGDILFDEKIKGSLHFTPGRAYQDAFNGNTSAIHWDLVLIQRKDHGGGEIYFDDILIRKDGEFVLPELKALNCDKI